MKRKGKIWFFIVAAIIVFLTYTTAFGLNNYYGDITTPIIKSAADIRFGIDIRGGVEVAFVPAVEDIQATEQQMEAAQAVIEQRLMVRGISDYELYKDVDRSRLILRFPWSENEVNFNPEAAIQELSTAAVLTFREGGERDEATGAPSGATAETVILEGNDVANAVAAYGPTRQGGPAEHHVQLTLSEEGTRKFSEATARIAAASGSISIWMDDAMISNPNVTEAINDDTAIISGSFTPESAKYLADTINAGSLPFALTAESYSTISPTLGSRSLQAMVWAGLVALVLVVAFMIFNYRLPGIVASISLIGQVAATIAFVSGYFAVFQSNTLTLPGIAGIILAIGMGVDANVITAERIKEELRSGKKLDAALKAGFKRGVAPIVDGNVTVLIVAAILMGAFGPTDGFFATIFSPIFRWFGAATTGTIYSFGFTLLVGVVLNFVFGILATRAMLTSISKFKRLRKPIFYGGLKEGKELVEPKPFNVVGNRRRFFAISFALIIVIAVASFVMGVNVDVQFRGGAIVNYGYTGEVDSAAVDTAVDAALGDDATVQLGTNASGMQTMTITLPGSNTLTAEKLDAVSTKLNEEFVDNTFEQLEVNNVDPSMGSRFLIKCIVAVLVASILILVYIAFRFRRIGGWRGGLTAVVALVHDLIVVYGVFVLLGIPLSGNFIAAMLTILGYSINDTVVIYDRVRENRTLFGRRTPFSRIVNLSINQSLKRSVNTTVTTITALGCVCIFAIVYGLNSIFSFAFPMMIGMISGVYSTVCIAGPLWVGWEKRLQKETKDAKAKDKAKRVEKTVKEEVKKETAEKEDTKAETTEEMTEETKEPKKRKARR